MSFKRSTSLPRSKLTFAKWWRRAARAVPPPIHQAYYISPNAAMRSRTSRCMSDTLHSGRWIIGYNSSKNAFAG